MIGIFTDRQHAGQQLAARLLHCKGEDPLVLAVPRGGVAIGVEVAKILRAPLDLVLVRKIGVPFRPELAAGAVVDGEHAETVWNRDILRELELSEDSLEDDVAQQLREIERRRKVYLGDRPRPRIAGRTAIVVDDGIATGATIRAALIGVRRSGPKRLVLAVPVAPPDTIESLRKDVDELICLEAPEPFGAIGQFYIDFAQLEDADVIDFLGRVSQPIDVAESIV
jgi:predicted phosphoribosyltransferase